MQKYVFTIKEDICTANNCTDKVQYLLSILPKYGDLVDYDVAVANVKDDYQRTIDNLTEQLNVLKDHNLTPEEIRVLNVIRQADIEKGKKREEEYAAERAQLIAEKTASDQKVVAIKTEFSNYKRRILSIVGGETEN